MDTGLTEERSDRRERDKGKEGQIIISTREIEWDSIGNNAKRSGFPRSQLHILSLWVQRQAYKLGVG